MNAKSRWHLCKISTLTCVAVVSPIRVNYTGRNENLILSSLILLGPSVARHCALAKTVTISRSTGSNIAQQSHWPSCHPAVPHPEVQDWDGKSQDWPTQQPSRDLHTTAPVSFQMHPSKAQDAALRVWDPAAPRTVPHSQARTHATASARSAKLCINLTASPSEQPSFRDQIKLIELW